MMTWNDARNYLRSSYSLNSESEIMISLITRVGDERSQIIFIHVFGEGLEYGHLRFFSPFAQAGQISPQQLVAVTQDATLGILTFADLHGFSHISFLANLDFEEIDRAIAITGILADGTEQQLGLGDDL